MNALIHAMTRGVKTHGQTEPEVTALIASGRIQASGPIREPREMALSIADKDARARKMGVLPFAELVEPSDALPSIRLSSTILPKR